MVSTVIVIVANASVSSNVTASVLFEPLSFERASPKVSARPASLMALARAILPAASRPEPKSILSAMVSVFPGSPMSLSAVTAVPAPPKPADPILPPAVEPPEPMSWAVKPRPAKRVAMRNEEPPPLVVTVKLTILPSEVLFRLARSVASGVSAEAFAVLSMLT